MATYTALQMSGGGALGEVLNAGQQYTFRIATPTFTSQSVYFGDAYFILNSSAEGNPLITPTSAVGPLKEGLISLTQTFTTTENNTFNFNVGGAGGNLIDGDGPTPTGTGAGWSILSQVTDSGDIDITAAMVDTAGAAGGTVRFLTNTAGAIVSCTLGTTDSANYAIGSVITIPQATLQASALNNSGTGNAIITLVAGDVSTQGSGGVIAITSVGGVSVRAEVTRGGQRYKSGDSISISQNDLQAAGFANANTNAVVSILFSNIANGYGVSSNLAGAYDTPTGDVLLQQFASSSDGVNHIFNVGFPIVQNAGSGNGTFNFTPTNQIPVNSYTIQSTGHYTLFIT